MADPVRVGSIGDWSHVELARVIRREIDRNAKKTKSDPNVNLSALIDLTLQYDADDNGTGAFILKSGPDMRWTLDNTGQLIWERGGNVGVFLGTAAVEQNRFFQIYNSINDASAAGIMVGGLLVSDSYGLASPTAGNAYIQKSLQIGTASVASVGSVTARGNSAGYIFYDRAETNGWQWYASGGNARLWVNDGTGDVWNFTNGGMYAPTGTNRIVSFGSAASNQGGYVQFIQTDGSTRKGFFGWYTSLNDSLSVGYSGVVWQQENGWAQVIDVAGGKAFISRSGTYDVEFGNNTYSIVTARSIFVNGTAYSSDARLKNNIVDLTNAINVMKALKPRAFNWNDPASHGGQVSAAGFIADEVQNTLPDAVLVNGDKDTGMRALDYTAIVAYSASAIQNLIKRVELLEAATPTPAIPPKPTT